MSNHGKIFFYFFLGINIFVLGAYFNEKMIINVKIIKFIIYLN